jgi:FecR protein
MFEEKRAKSEEMGSDYLWDGTGAPDPELQRLEKILVTFRHSAGKNPAFAIPAQRKSERFAHFVNRFWLPCFAAAVIITFVLASNVMIRRIAMNPENGDSGWSVARIAGTPQIGRRFIGPNGPTTLSAGQTLETNENSSASISSNDLGEVKVDPNSRVRLLQSDANKKRIQLQVGTIHAMIWAPPGQFEVDTPSAVAVDLGCAYTLEVSPDGSGKIRTTMGWVGFRLNGRDSFIPAGAMCATRPHVGPGTPYFEDASTALQSALSTFDADTAGGGPGESHAAALQIVLSQARPRDALTLWHLLFRTEGADRQSVFARLSELAPPPAGVTRDGVLHLRGAMLDAWWNSLGLGNISLWRYWERSETPGGPSTVQKFQKKVAVEKQPR